MGQAGSAGRRVAMPENGLRSGPSGRIGPGGRGDGRDGAAPASGDGGEIGPAGGGRDDFVPGDAGATRPGNPATGPSAGPMTDVDSAPDPLSSRKSCDRLRLAPA